MKHDRKKYFNLFFLFMFLTVTLFINFLHSETTFVSDVKCPACNFMSSSVMSGQINFFHLPPPSITGILKTYEIITYSGVVIPNPISRAPPGI